MFCLYTLDSILNSELARQTLVQCTVIIVESCIDPFVLARRVYSKEIIPKEFLHERQHIFILRESKDTANKLL